MQVVIFNIGKERFALETRLVHGIEKMMNITYVPKAPYYIRGLANLRGNIISVIDLKKYLNVDSEKVQENIIIVEVQEEKVGLMVDSVQEVVDITDDMLEKINNENTLTRGVINFKDYIVTLLDGENLIK
ncbi:MULTISPECIES: chemotaxis protein CheW [Caloramator]|uniref:Purine-binding chemotaxis protein CheW n=1 Tax=Caloramator proteoclasticus DSM 10124 TaxID=1121262 RepID=A0A1M4SVW5_9CLOT|nr:MULTISPECIES: chemotaxis protein CheW [Caloramator]SHE36335.1 purine-binding chemotaxis protein CheW [Caloramator proteoclasticus DSM 10124]